MRVRRVALLVVGAAIITTAVRRATVMVEYLTESWFQRDHSPYRVDTQEDSDGMS